MEVKSNILKISLLFDIKEKAEILNWQLRTKLKIKLVSVRKGTVVKVFQAWQIEVGSIGPQPGPETWENTHTPITLTPQKSKYTLMYKQTHVQAHIIYVYTKPSVVAMQTV